jgi:hypothetical protein
MRSKSSRVFRAALGGMLHGDVLGRSVKCGELSRGEIQNIRGEPPNASARFHS